MTPIVTIDILETMSVDRPQFTDEKSPHQRSKLDTTRELLSANPNVYVAGEYDIQYTNHRSPYKYIMISPTNDLLEIQDLNKFGRSIHLPNYHRASIAHDVIFFGESEFTDVIARRHNKIVTTSTLEVIEPNPILTPGTETTEKHTVYELKRHTTVLVWPTQQYANLELRLNSFFSKFGGTEQGQRFLENIIKKLGIQNDRLHIGKLLDIEIWEKMQNGENPLGIIEEELLQIGM